MRYQGQGLEGPASNELTPAQIGRARYVPPLDEPDTDPSVKEAATIFVRAAGRVAREFFLGTPEEQDPSGIETIDKPSTDSDHSDTEPKTIPVKTGIVDQGRVKRLEFLNSIKGPGVVGSKERDKLRRPPSRIAR